MLRELITKLAGFTAPSGSEQALAEYLLSIVKDYADETYIDTLGNAVAHKRGDGPHTLLTAHMDEPGVMVIHIDDCGFLRLVSVGNLAPTQLIGRQILFSNGVHGVLQAEQVKDKEAITFDKLYVDIGASSKEAAQDSVYIGLAGVVTEELVSIGDHALSGRALDNRVGCAVAIEVFRQAAADGKQVTLAFTSQETVGNRGIKTVAHRVQPDWALVIDGVPAGDTPGSKRMEVKLGKGPAVKIMDKSIVVPVAVKDHLIDAAKSANVDVQFEVRPDAGSDAGTLHLSTTGIPTGGISYPVRYVDSSSPIVDLRDAEQCVQILLKAVQSKA
ncbi:peptidase M42 [Alicyclobacillus sp. SO9]|uniref:peptidase M42 n=1 Tax=Alicyclobacillus sp. SO9 TaxID=2665646 RepID=UPI0018E7A80C|nr:peptidase M42 [Alicyclobacillus sp. SO9]QQE76803.1 peptidase M42 [Alicyclobacillus sp. SO9]